MKIYVECNVENCIHNKDGECNARVIVIAEENCMTVEFSGVKSDGKIY